MKVAFDNTFLSLVLNPGSKPRPNPATGQPADHCKERIDALIDKLSKRGDTVLIPTPCLSELLCVVPSLEKAIQVINQSTSFEVAAFDERCAIDLAQEVRRALAAGDKRSGTIVSWNEVKFDRQIAVISKAYGADTLYTDDATQATFAMQIGLSVVHSWHLELPSSHAQLGMF